MDVVQSLSLSVSLSRTPADLEHSNSELQACGFCGDALQCCGDAAIALEA